MSEQDGLPDAFDEMKWWIVWSSQVVTEDGVANVIEHMVGYPVKPDEERMDAFDEEIREEFGLNPDNMVRTLLTDEEGRALLKMMEDESE